MMKIYFKDGAGGIKHLENGILTDGVCYCENPIGAESRYFSLIRIRTEGPGSVIIDASRSAASLLVASAHYRTDRIWIGPREQDLDRRSQVWGMLQGLPHPTIYQCRGVAKSCGLVGRDMAAMLGVDDRTIRRWMSETEPHKMPPAAWTALMIKLDYLALTETASGPS